MFLKRCFNFYASPKRVGIWPSSSTVDINTKNQYPLEAFFKNQYLKNYFKDKTRACNSYDARIFLYFYVKYM